MPRGVVAVPEDTKGGKVGRRSGCGLLVQRQPAGAGRSRKGMRERTNERRGAAEVQQLQQRDLGIAQ